MPDISSSLSPSCGSIAYAALLLLSDVISRIDAIAFFCISVTPSHTPSVFCTLLSRSRLRSRPHPLPFLLTPHSPFAGVGNANVDHPN